MAESTRVPDLEIKRREDFMRVNQRPRTYFDPYSWNYPWKGAALMGALCLTSAHFYNLFRQKPWYYGLYPRIIGTAALCLAGYGMGTMREHNHRVRDAIVDHYISQHPADFERMSDIYGRPFSNVLLPWYPRRSGYRKFD